MIFQNTVDKLQDTKNSFPVNFSLPSSFKNFLV